MKQLRFFSLLVIILLSPSGAQNIQQGYNNLRRLFQGGVVFNIDGSNTNAPTATAPGAKPVTIAAPPPATVMFAPPSLLGIPKSSIPSKPLLNIDYGDYSGGPIQTANGVTIPTAPGIPLSAPDQAQLLNIRNQKQNQTQAIAQQQGIQSQFSAAATSNTLNQVQLLNIQKQMTNPTVPQYSIPSTCSSIKYTSAYQAISSNAQFYYYQKIIDNFMFLQQPMYQYLASPTINVTIIAPTNIAIQKTAYSLGYKDTYTFLTDNAAGAVRAYIALYSIVQGQVDFSSVPYYSNTTLMMLQDPSNLTNVQYACGRGSVKYSNVTVQKQPGGIYIQDGIKNSTFEAGQKKQVIQACSALIYPTNQTLLPCDPFISCSSTYDKLIEILGSGSSFLQYINQAPDVQAQLQDPAWKGTVFVPQDSGIARLQQQLKSNNLPADSNSPIYQTFQQQIAKFHIIDGALIYLDPSNVGNSTVNMSTINPSQGPVSFTTSMQNFSYCYTNQSNVVPGAPASAPTALNPQTLPKLVVSKAVGSAKATIFSSDDVNETANVLATDILTCNGLIQIVNTFAIPCRLPVVKSQSLSFGGAPGQGSASTSSGGSSGQSTSSLRGSSGNKLCTSQTYYMILASILLALSTQYI